MRDLETLIAEWRAGMLAAGIKAPATLDELESHLRDDVEVLGIGLMTAYGLLGVAWLSNVSMTFQERVVGASGLLFFPVIWSWRFTYRFLPAIPVNALGKRVRAWLLRSALGVFCTVALIRFLPTDENGAIASPYLGAFVWAWLPMVVGFSWIIGLERRRRSAISAA